MNAYVEPAHVTGNGTLKGAPILSFAVDRWDDVPRCRHHVMARLARSHRVLFVSPQRHLRNALDAPPPGTGEVRRVDENLYTYIPSRWLPYSHRPLLNRLLSRLHVFAIKRLMRRLGMERPILYLWHPAFAHLIGRFGERAVVYHCYDEYAAFGGSDRERVTALETRLLESADVVFAVSEGLRALKARVNPNTHLVPNGVDYELFAAAQDPATPLAPELRDLPKPVVGCVTRIVPEYFDADLLRQIFTRRPDWSFVVVGPESAATTRAKRALDALKALPNVHLLGRREFSSLPSYLKGFDACLIPYVLSENKLLADPLKLYEYLAAGKPVISKPLPFPDNINEVIAKADGVDEWVDAIDRAMRTDSPAAVARRQAVARASTWDARVGQISTLIAAADTEPA